MSEIWSLRGTGAPLLAWRWSKPRGKQRGQLLGAKNGPPADSQQRRPQSSSPKELKSANSKNELGSRFSPKPSDENSAQPMPWPQSCKPLGREPRHTTPHFWPRQLWANTRVLLHAAKLVIICFATIENNTNEQLYQRKQELKLDLRMTQKALQRNRKQKSKRCERHVASLFHKPCPCFSSLHLESVIEQDLLVLIADHLGPPVDYKFHVKALALVHCLCPQSLGQPPTHSRPSVCIGWVNGWIDE